MKYVTVFLVQCVQYFWTPYENMFLPHIIKKVILVTTIIHSILRVASNEMEFDSINIQSYDHRHPNTACGPMKYVVFFC
jgi:hypothetical protein